VSKRYVLSEYVDLAMGQALYDKLEDNSFSGRIPCCPSVLSFATTLKECEEELRSTLEDWVLVGLKLRHRLPVIGNIDLNKEPAREPVDFLVSVANSSASSVLWVSTDLLGSPPSVPDSKRKSPDDSLK